MDRERFMVILLAASLAGSMALLRASEARPGSELEWTIQEGVSIPVPPAEHPRLYLRSRDLPELRRRTTAPATHAFWEKMQATSKKDRAIAIEVDALRFLLTSDSDLGRILGFRRELSHHAPQRQSRRAGAWPVAGRDFAFAARKCRLLPQCDAGDGSGRNTSDGDF